MAIFWCIPTAQTVQTVNAACLNEAHIIANQVDSTLRRIEATTALIADNLDHDAAMPSAEQQTRINRELHALAQDFPESSGYFVFDAQGALLYGSDVSDAQISIADRAYVMDSQQTPDSSLRSSETLAGQISGQPVMMAYRALLDTAGEFRGLIVAPVNLTYFSKLFSEIRVGEQGIISLRRSDDSRLVVRWPIVAAYINRPAIHTPPYQRIMAGERRGIIRYLGSVDGIDRIFAFHQIDGFPFYVLVGRAVEEQFRVWRNSAMIATALTLSALLLTGIFLVRIRQGEAVLRQSEQRFRDLALTLGDWIWEVDQDGRYTYVSSPVRLQTRFLKRSGHVCCQSLSA